MSLNFNLFLYEYLDSDILECVVDKLIKGKVHREIHTYKNIKYSLVGIMNIENRRLNLKPISDKKFNFQIPKCLHRDKTIILSAIFNSIITW